MNILHSVFYWLGVSVFSIVALWLFWALIKPLLQAVSVVSGMIYARWVNKELQTISFIDIPKAIIEYYRRFAFDSWETICLSNDVFEWRGIFKWTVYRKQK